MTEMNVISHLTREELFGSQTGLAKAAGCAPHTICGKRNSDNPLTYRQMCRILEAARQRNLPLTPADFFPWLVGAAKSKRKKAA